jgi:hypothetical protein
MIWRVPSSALSKHEATVQQNEIVLGEQLWMGLENRINRSHMMYFLDSEAAPLNQSYHLCLRTGHAIVKCEQLHACSAYEAGARFSEKHLAQHKFLIGARVRTCKHGFTNVFQNRNDLIVRPVMQNMANQVGWSTLWNACFVQGWR